MTDEFKFTFKRACVDGWSSVCVDGFAVYDVNGVKIDLQSLNPVVTDTGFWRSGAHSYIGEEILEGVGLSYCSEPIQCTSDVLDDEIVTIRLDQPVAFSSFELQQSSKLAYRPEEFTLDIANSDGTYEAILISDFDLTNREIRNFINTCRNIPNPFCFIIWHTFETLSKEIFKKFSKFSILESYKIFYSNSLLPRCFVLKLNSFTKGDAGYVNANTELFSRLTQVLPKKTKKSFC